MGKVFKSKLSETAYPTVPLSEVPLWLIFVDVPQSEIDPVFARRLAAFAKFKGKKIHINRGSVTKDQQAAAFFRYGGKYDKVKGYYYPESVPQSKRKAALPGRSWHEFRLAIDTSDLWFKAINKFEATSKQAELIKFGIFKPLTKGNKKTVLEDWHVQPIETNGQTDKDKFAPTVVTV